MKHLIKQYFDRVISRRNFLSATAAGASLAAAEPLLAQTKPTPAAAAASPPAPSAGQTPRQVNKIEIISLRDLESAAQKVLPAAGFRHISAAAGDEWTKRENEAAYKHLTIVPRHLTGYGDADLTTSLLGSKISMPITAGAQPLPVS